MEVETALDLSQLQAKAKGGNRQGKITSAMAASEPNNHDSKMMEMHTCRMPAWSISQTLGQ